LAARLSPLNAGVAVAVAAMFLYYVGIKAVEPRTAVTSFVLLLYGLTLALGGWEFFRVLFFPITFLLLMIPLNFLDEVIGFPLRQIVAAATVSLLNWFGIEAYRMGNGTGIYSSVFHFDVADPCSGIRSLMALTTVTAFYGYITQHRQWKRWVLFLSAMPLAVLGNLARVVSIALVAEVYGQDLATKVYHDWSGFILFPVALTAMVVIGVLLNLPYRRIAQNWLKPLPATERPASETSGPNPTKDFL
jgi:exosortase